MAKKPKIHKGAKNGQKERKVSFFSMSKPSGTQILLVRGSRRSKKSILTDFEFFAKKKLKSVTSIIKVQNGQNSQNT